jgi:hypothetical protein
MLLASETNLLEAIAESTNENPQIQTDVNTHQFDLEDHTNWFEELIGKFLFYFFFS